MVMWLWLSIVALAVPRLTNACGSIAERSAVKKYLKSRLEDQVGLYDTSGISDIWTVSLKEGQLTGVQRLSVEKLTSSKEKGRKLEISIKFDRLECSYGKRYEKFESHVFPETQNAWRSACTDNMVLLQLDLSAECKVTEVNVEFQTLNGCEKSLNNVKLDQALLANLKKYLDKAVIFSVEKELKRALKGASLKQE